MRTLDGHGLKTHLVLRRNNLVETNRRIAKTTLRRVPHFSSALFASSAYPGTPSPINADAGEQSRLWRPPTAASTPCTNLVARARSSWHLNLSSEQRTSDIPVERVGWTTSARLI